MNIDTVFNAFYALVFSGVFVHIGFGWINYYRECVSREDQLDMVLGIFYNKLSYEWKFVEELVEELFLDEDIEIRKALDYLLGNHLQEKITQILLVEAMVFHYLENKILQGETVEYSKTNIKQNPSMFRSLPAWRRDLCDCELQLCNNLLPHIGSIEDYEEMHVPLLRVRKISSGSPRNRKSKMKNSKYLPMPKPVFA